MGKNSNIRHLARFMALAVAHKIGSLVESTAIYREKYEKEFNSFMVQAVKIRLRENWSSEDKDKIRKEVMSETTKELIRKAHIPDEKLNFISKEVDNALKEAGLL